MIRTYRWADGVEQLSACGAALPVRVLILPALFDEANRMRRTTVQLMHRLAAAGVGALLPDLPGTGESEVELARVTWRDWTQAVAAAAEALPPRPRLTVAIRGGALLDRHAGTDAEPGHAWRLSPETGARLFRDLDRARRLGGGTAPAYAMAPELLDALADAVPIADARVRTVRLAGDPAPADRHVEGARLWRHAEPGEDAVLVDRLAEDIAAWAHACAR